jgi:hypothetical protein
VLHGLWVRVPPLVQNSQVAEAIGRVMIDWKTLS